MVKAVLDTRSELHLTLRNPRCDPHPPIGARAHESQVIINKVLPQIQLTVFLPPSSQKQSKLFGHPAEHPFDPLHSCHADQSG